MKTYSQFRPTGFDPVGLGLREQQDWLVAPVSQTRDSGPLDQSNFAAALKALGGESEAVEVHRFGHWGPGWFEIILIDPTRTDLVQIGEDIEATLADYPVLDEMDLSAREWDDYVETWNQCGLSRDMVKTMAKEFELGEATTDFLESIDPDTLRGLYEELTPSGNYYETCDNGANFGRRVQYAVERLTRERLAQFIRGQRIFSLSKADKLMAPPVSGE